jgi:hypothetical protein
MTDIPDMDMAGPGLASRYGLNGFSKHAVMTMVVLLIDVMEYEYEQPQV